MSAVLDPGYRTAAATKAGELGAVIRRDHDDLEMVNLRWGLRPKEEGGRSVTVIRSEGRQFGSDRCLVPASEFYLSRGGKRYRFALANGDWFYFAGIWRPQSSGWPAAYAVLTIEPNPEIAPYHDRQMAVIRRDDRMAWLDRTAPQEELVRPLPASSFAVEEATASGYSQPRFNL